MSWEKQLDLYIDVAKYGAGTNPLLTIATDSVAQAPAPVLVQGDHFRLRLFFRSVSGATATPVDLGENTAIVVAAKKLGALGAESNLFAATGFALEGEGTAACWSAWCDLHTDELEAAFGTTDEIRVRMDIEVQTIANDRRTTFQVDCTVRRHAYAGEGEPTPAGPVYPSPDAIVTKLRGTVDLTEDDGGVTVTGLALGAAPAQVLLSLRIPSAEASLIPYALAGAPTADGFSVIFGAAIPDEGYKLDYLVIL